MERRNRSLEALEQLNYINSLDPADRASALVGWVEKYLQADGIFNFDLELKDLEKLSELFYTNIAFLKEHKENTRQEVIKTKRMKKFLEH